MGKPVSVCPLPLRTLLPTLLLTLVLLPLRVLRRLPAPEPHAALAAAVAAALAAVAPAVAPAPPADDRLLVHRRAAGIDRHHQLDHHGGGLPQLRRHVRRRGRRRRRKHEVLRRGWQVGGAVSVRSGARRLRLRLRCCFRHRSRGVVQHHHSPRVQGHLRGRLRWDRVPLRAGQSARAAAQPPAERVQAVGRPAARAVVGGERVHREQRRPGGAADGAVGPPLHQQPRRHRRPRQGRQPPGLRRGDRGAHRLEGHARADGRELRRPGHVLSQRDPRVSGGEQRARGPQDLARGGHRPRRAAGVRGQLLLVGVQLSRLQHGQHRHLPQGRHAADGAGRRRVFELPRYELLLSYRIVTPSQPALLCLPLCLPPTDGRGARSQAATTRARS